MEIVKLNLIAFGPFSDRQLDFSPPGGGLHIVYGPNEAGKSSSLRGLNALLFGIPTRTNDNFLHENKNLRIGGTLRVQSGAELSIIRRKGNKNTLLSSDGEQLSDSVLNPFLHGISAEIFEMMFGIDHDSLAKGGKEILEQKGEVGQALFSASMGSVALHGVLEQLDVEADELFKPNGSKQVINSALKKYSELQKVSKERTLSSKEWGDVRHSLEKTNRDLNQVHDELVECKAERNRLSRIKRALPKIASWRELKKQLDALGDVIVLPEDFGKRREVAAGELDTALAMASGATSNLTGLQEQFAAVQVRNEVLELSETIEALHARLGGQRKAMADRPHLEEQYSQLMTDAEARLKAVRPEFGLDDAESLRPVLSKSIRITELGNQRQALMDRVGHSSKTARELESQLQQMRKSHDEITESASTDKLSTLVMKIRKEGDLGASLQASQAQIELLEAECSNHLSRLSTQWQGTLEDIPGLPLPARESVDRFERVYDELETKQVRLEEKRDEYIQKEIETKTDLGEIEHVGIIPNEQDLRGTRTDRDSVWQLLRRHWVNNESVDAEAREIDSERTLPDVFESRIVDADEVADRLRREADRVQKQASLLAVLEETEQLIEGNNKAREVCATEQQQLDEEWVDLWRSLAIRPLPPKEMHAWLDNIEKLRERVTEMEGLRRTNRDLDNQYGAYIQELQQELRTLGKELASTELLEITLIHGESVIRIYEEAVRQRVLLDDKIEEILQRVENNQTEQSEAGEALETWKGQWHEIVGELGLDSDALPAEVNNILENVRSLFEKLSEATKVRRRIKSIDTDTQNFCNEVKNVVSGVASEYPELPAEDAVARLNQLLNEASEQSTLRQQLDNQMQDAQVQINTAETTRKTMADRLEALCKEAQCTDASELELADGRSTEYQSLRRRINEHEEEIHVIGEGMTITKLEADVDQANPDTLSGEMDVLTGKIDEELDPRKTELAVEKGEQKKELDLMDGSDDAAVLADEAQSILVGVQSNAERYVLVKLASRILHDEIERYRQQHQGPLLERASEHFAVLTQNSFSGLRADFNEKDEPVLVGVRPNDEHVFVYGMSAGTRDQLYLALRLASLEKYMDSAEPVPFIVDDILVHFDDQRSKATLAVLAKLAQKTQIILFTHHLRLVEQARSLTVELPVVVHEL